MKGLKNLAFGVELHVLEHGIHKSLCFNLMSRVDERERETARTDEALHMGVCRDGRRL